MRSEYIFKDSYKIIKRLEQFLTRLTDSDNISYNFDNKY